MASVSVTVSVLTVLHITIRSIVVGDGVGNGDGVGQCEHTITHVFNDIFNDIEIRRMGLMQLQLFF